MAHQTRVDLERATADRLSALAAADRGSFECLVELEAVRLFPDLQVHWTYLALLAGRTPGWLERHQTAEARALYWTGVVQPNADSTFARLVDHCLVFFAQLDASKRNELRSLASWRDDLIRRSGTRLDPLHQAKLVRLERARRRFTMHLGVQPPIEYRDERDIAALEATGLDAMLSD